MWSHFRARALPNGLVGARIHGEVVPWWIWWFRPIFYLVLSQTIHRLYRGVNKIKKHEVSRAPLEVLYQLHIFFPIAEFVELHVFDRNVFCQKRKKAKHSQTNPLFRPKEVMHCHYSPLHWNGSVAYLNTVYTLHCGKLFFSFNSLYICSIQLNV